MNNFIRHLFIPQESNNHRSKLLHHGIVLFFIALLFLGQFFITTTKTNFSTVLGSTINISVEDLVNLTNQKRQAQNLPSLSLSDSLNYAAMLKANDMFNKNYWAHNAPDGTTPWFFIKKAGYSYVYAGENLARGFTDSGSVVDAWMASPSHRENVLSPNYNEVGFAIKRGNLLGEDTTLVVEMFGSTGVAPIAKQSKTSNLNNNTNQLLQAAAPETSSNKVNGTFDLNTLNQLVAPLSGNYVKTSALIDSKAVTINISLLILLLFIFVLILDMIIIERKKIVRLVGHNIDHVFFLGAIFIIIILTTRGLVI